jgi:glycosyltransferase involved in cell wall biosynthesis
MIIGMLLNAPYPSDVRIRKEADALLAAGHQVHLLCLRRDGEKNTELVEGIRVQRIDAGKNKIGLAFWDIIMTQFRVHWRFAQRIPAWVKINKIEVLHIHDLPLAGTALALRSNLSVKVVCDFHENYPDALRVWFAWRKNIPARIKNKLFLSPDRWQRYEEEAVKKSDHIIAVVQEMKDRLLANYHADPAKITVVTNSEDASFLKQPRLPDVYEDLTGKFIIAYTGNIGPHRGVDTAIEAMPFLRDFPDIVLAIVGSGGEEVMQNLRRMIEAHGVQQQVRLFGRQPFNKFYSYMHFAQVNIIPHKSNSHTNNTVPHKLFQGMMTGSTMLVSSSPPLKRIVEATQSGLVFEAENARDLADKIKQLYQNPELRRTLGMNGLKATTESTYNWEHDQQALLNVYADLQKQPA